MYCNYVHIYIYMYTYVHAIQNVSCSQMLEVSLVMKHLGSDHLPKSDLIVYMQRRGTPEWLRRWKLHGTTRNIKKYRLLAEGCSQGDWLAVQQLLSQGRNIHQPGEDGESLLYLACSAGSYELAEVLLKMRSGMDDKGMKGVYLE